MEQVRTATAAERWEGRPWLARVLRATAWLAPVLTSTLAVFVASRSIARPPGPWALLWWVAMMAWGTLTLWVTDRLARRLLPLAALLKLSLVFPDAAPSRFGLALRGGTARRFDVADRDAEPSTPAGAAARLAWLVAELHAHDRRTRGHAERVRAYTALLGRELGLDAADTDRLQWAALLHDVGKLAVPPSILNKPGDLSEEEFELVKTHAAEGAKLVEPLRWWLGEWTDAVGEHHEKWDGTGYPQGLRRHQISLAGRIVAVADVFDVMTAARAYKTPRHASAARAELTRCAGTHFDPQVVRAFLSISIGRLHRRIGPLAWLADIPVLGSVSTAAGVAATAVVPPMAGSVVAAALAALLVVPRPEVVAPDPGLALGLPATTSVPAPAVPTTAGEATTSAPAPTTVPVTSSPAPTTTVTPTPTTVPVTTPRAPVTAPATTTTAAAAAPPTTTAATPPPTSPAPPSPTTTSPPAAAAPPTSPPTSAPTTTAAPSTTTTTGPAPLTAQSDSYSTDRNGLTADLTGNDTGASPSGTARVVLVRRDAGEVTADFNGNDGNVTFRPGEGFTGTAQFTYWIRDGAGRQSSAAVTVTVS